MTSMSPAMSQGSVSVPVPPRPESIRGLGRMLDQIGYSVVSQVCPDHRGWMTLPREMIRKALMPDVPEIFARSVYARSQQQALSRKRPDLAILYRLMVRAETVSRGELKHLDQNLLDLLIKAGVVGESGDSARALFRLVPAAGKYFLADFPGADKRGYGLDYVHLGSDSAILASVLAKEAGNGRQALDLCSGSGIQGIVVSPKFAQVVGIEINRRAVAMSEANAALNDAVAARFVSGDLYDGLNDRYDLICSNPPFVLLPEKDASWNLTGFGGALGMSVTLKILEGLDSHLSDTGRAIIYTQGPTIDGRCRLVEETSTRLGGQAFSIHFQEVIRTFAPDQRALWDSLGVQWFTSYFVRIRRAKAFTVTVQPLTGWRAVLVRAAMTVERRRN